jgi:hypothetical protein
LRYATAAVTRRAREAGAGASAGAAAVAGDPWGDAPKSMASKPAADDAWANPGAPSMSDDTPF